MFASMPTRTRSPIISPPAWIKPELAAPVKAAPEGTDWLHEMKLDGYRMRRPARCRSCPNPDPPRQRLAAKIPFGCQRYRHSPGQERLSRRRAMRGRAGRANSLQFDPEFGGTWRCFVGL